SLPRNPHLFLTPIGNPDFRPISLEAQRQIAIFFASDGTEIIHPEPERFFEVPIQGPLPEDLNYIPQPPLASASPSPAAGSNPWSQLLRGGWAWVFTVLSPPPATAWTVSPVIPPVPLAAIVPSDGSASSPLGVLSAAASSDAVAGTVTPSASAITHHQ